MSDYPTPQDDIAALRAILGAAFPGVPVSTRLPRNFPIQCIRITRIGGGGINLVTDSGRELIECWAQTGPVARGMTRTARGALRNATGREYAGVFIRGWMNEQGPVDLPDPDYPDWYRWQFHGDLLCSMAPGS